MAVEGWDGVGELGPWRQRPLAVQSPGRRSTQLLVREALGGRLRMARTVGAQGEGEGARRFWTSPGLGERDRVPSEGLVLGALGHCCPGGVSATSELPGPSAGRACSGAPDPRGNPPVPSARVTGHRQAKGFRALHTADGGCRGPKVNLLWQRPATRDPVPPLARRSLVKRIRTDSAEVSQPGCLTCTMIAVLVPKISTF